MRAFWQRHEVGEAALHILLSKILAQAACVCLAIWSVETFQSMRLKNWDRIVFRVRTFHIESLRVGTSHDPPAADIWPFLSSASVHRDRDALPNHRTATGCETAGLRYSDSYFAKLPGSDFFFVVAFFFFNFMYLFIAALGLCCCARAFSSCSSGGYALCCGTHNSHCHSFSCCGAWAPRCMGFTSCSSWAPECRLSSCGAQSPCSMRHLSGPGIKPLAPYLAGGFFTTGLPGKSPALIYWSKGELWKEGAIFPEVDPGASTKSSRKPHHRWGQKDADRKDSPISHQWLSLEFIICSVQFSHSVVSDSLQPHESQHARPPCPSPTPGVHSNSHPSSQWCHLVISSSVFPFSSCPKSLPASKTFPMSQLSAWGGQSTAVSALASFPLKNTQGWSLKWIGWISLQSKGLSRVFSNTTVIICGLK